VDGQNKALTKPALAGVDISRAAATGCGLQKTAMGVNRPAALNGIRWQNRAKLLTHRGF
jgi:hypothetical protein